jgi:hypothetical protein
LRGFLDGIDESRTQATDYAHEATAGRVKTFV